MGSSGGNKPGGQARGSGTSRSGGKPGGGFSSGTQGFQPGGSFWDFNPRPIAGLNEFQRGAGGIAAGLGGQGAGNLSRSQRYYQQLGAGQPGAQQAVSAANRYAGGQLPGQFNEAAAISRNMMDTGRRQVTGANIQSSPSYSAARKAFAQSQLPLIQNQAAAAGLGRSSAMTNAISHGNAQAMLPMIENELMREERGIGRELQSQGQAAGNLMGIGGQALGANNAAVQAMMQQAGMNQQGLSQAAQGQAGLGQQRFNQGLQQSGLLSQLGNQYRGVEQQQLDAPYQEQQRQYAEALNAMYGPLGFLGNMGGASTTTSGKK